MTMKSAATALLTAALVLLSGCDTDDRTPLVIYSPHGADMLSAFEARFEELNPAVDVQWLDMGSQEVLDRVRSERANPQADIWWGAPAPMFETAAADGLLESFAPTWAGGVPPDARSAEGFWHGTYLTPEVIAYNTNLVLTSQVPDDWEDVLLPQWQGEVLIRDPVASGTMRTIFGMFIIRSIRETGDTAAGFEWLRRLDAQTKDYVLNPTMLYSRLGRGEGALTLWDMPDIEELKAKTGYPIEYVFPSSGTPVPVDAVAIVRGAPNAQGARAFVEYIGGTEAVTRAARVFHRLPARSDIPADSLPERLRDARDRIVTEPMDWDLFQRESANWMRHWDEHVRGRGRPAAE
ncbi:MAG: extracellular solute-binding protein [Gemmatimonadota bacterium]